MVVEVFFFFLSPLVGSQKVTRWLTRRFADSSKCDSGVGQMLSVRRRMPVSPESAMVRYFDTVGGCGRILKGSVRDMAWDVVACASFFVLKCKEGHHISFVAWSDILLLGSFSSYEPDHSGTSVAVVAVDTELDGLRAG